MRLQTTSFMTLLTYVYVSYRGLPGMYMSLSATYLYGVTVRVEVRASCVYVKFAGVFGIALQIVLCTHAILYLLTTKLSVKFAGAGRNICSTEVMNGPNHKRTNSAQP